MPPGNENDSPAGEEVRHLWELGHYYSPVPDTRQLAREPMRSRVWPAVPLEMPGIEWREEAQLELVRKRLLRQSFAGFSDQGESHEPRYKTGPENQLFPLADAWVLQAMLRELRPARVIEVGGGWSSLVTAAVNREHLDGGLDFTCIEPHPPAFLTDEIDGIAQLLDIDVQGVPLERFERLGENDVLFIDTSHVAKTGGDVPYLYHQIVPRLKPGVVVHIHDIFLPWDYPEEWVLGGRGWNEQYLVQSFLAFNDSFDVLLAVAWLCRTHPELFSAAIDGYDSDRHTGASLWLRRTRGASP